MSDLPGFIRERMHANGAGVAPKRRPRKIEREPKQTFVLYRQLDNQRWECLGYGTLDGIRQYQKDYNTVAWLRGSDGSLTQYQPAVRWHCVPVTVIGGAS